ncbi:hypothetical protein [Arcanobacterium bovis]|uniref:Beta-carotene 15,15'-monooxygenase n=1 Tax=Arcanobacterium bovis TaxID=2529275 RepID=A0A4Q9V0J7_9ACTO|nr:hypothetical protein [Arcanobacterium bovis]TBW22106.1 hypothetical protein EZJ44_04570 [Arcanobacterium bovis]
MSKPRTRRLRDFVALFWMLCAVFVVFGRSIFPGYEWLAIHMILLGAVSHSVLVWSEYFAHTLLKSPPTQRENKWQDARILAFAAGALAVFIGYLAKIWICVLVGAVLVVIAVIWHVVHLERKIRTSLPGRFLIVVRYYEISGILLPIGATFGALLAWGVSDEWRGRLLIAHISVNLLGWVGFTVIGTLITLWPTLLRTRMHDSAQKWAKQALAPLCCGLFVIVCGALSGYRLITAMGLVVYLVGLLWWGRSLISPMRAKGIREYAPAAVACAALWALLGLGVVGWALVTSPSWGDVTQYLPFIGVLFAAGFGIQILIGALSYLIPSLIGQGPATVRAVQARMNFAATFRLVTPNVALLLWIFPTEDGVRAALMALTVLVYAAFIPVMMSAIFTGLRVRRESGENRAFFVDPDPHRRQNLLQGNKSSVGSGSKERHGQVAK